MFADKKPRGALVIAEYPRPDLLREAIVFCGARSLTEHHGAPPTGEPLLAVPWFSTAKFREDQEETVRQFSAMVRAWLTDRSHVH